MPPSPEAELRMLEDYKKELEEELQDLQDEIKDVDARIEELKKLLSKG
jgi:peptidoglycan hydrolase CwlO-like protein